ncbi:DMT family transporter [Stenotrophobium rhamnosiphilum]|uniref:EamA family transporter n=1 Tax=Stenotrophobium rhamnosiphilum TaxID=2029166 RepID=A0A2T5MFL0_9GAMM|nr:DMT family transporter [Stenotrophobium rhamnosiphilum]PTU31368.1 EamA family transporter [Stenotrophobium rhamnosiphilum]
MSVDVGRSDLRALAALITGAVLIGLAPIFVRLSDVGLTATGFWRMALALPLLGVLMLRETGGIKIKPGIGWLLLAGVFFTGDLVFWHQSIHLSSVANATLMTNLAPVFVALASFLIFGERFRPAFIAGIALALVGAVVLMSGSMKLGAHNLLGDLLACISAVFYAGYILGVSRARQRYGAMEVMFWSTLSSAVLLCIVGNVQGDSFWPQSAHGWWVLIGLALLSHVAGQGLIAWALAHLSAAFSAVGLLVQPVAAAAFAWLILAEPFGTLQALGGAIVLAGIVTCRVAMPRATET